MKQIKLILLSFTLITPFLFLNAQEKVLFVGNSFTIGSGPSVPVIFDALARAGGQEDPTTVMRAVGGTDFKFHYTNHESHAAIHSMPWDYVIIQNYSTGPTHVRSVASHLAFGEKLYQEVMGNNRETRVILYETWSRSAVHDMISGAWSANTFPTTTDMQKELRKNYKLLADMLNIAYPDNPEVVVAPCGTAWENAGALKEPGESGFVKLHGGDEYHANDNGYYLNALVFYSIIYKASPVGLHLKPEIENLEGLTLTVDPALLEKVAWETYLEVFGEGEPESVE